MNCEFCQKPVELNKPGTLRWVSGWETIRGAGDGVQPIKDRQVHARVAHKLCQEIAAKGGTQESLLV